MGTSAQKLQKIRESKEAIRLAIAAKGVTIPANTKLADYDEKIQEISTGGVIGTGTFLVRFFDFDGTILKQQRVNAGENATAPTIPTHQYLTFAEWNNPFANVQSDIDTGAIYNTTDGKTYLFITLTAVTGLAPTIYFSKSTNSLMTINWGDGTTSTSATSGNQNINHIYASAGDYIITVDNSGGGVFGFQSYFLGNGTLYQKCIEKLYLGVNFDGGVGNQFRESSLKTISLGSNVVEGSAFIGLQNLKGLILNMNSLAYMFNGQVTNSAPIRKNTSTIIRDSEFFNVISKRKHIFNSNITTIENNAFFGNLSTLFYIFLSTTPPTLANINAFTGINPICKIYVPDASVEAYKAATNWVTYANYIYPLSEKPQSNE